MTRQRLTITLKKDVIRALDQTIDGDRIRNRSHAIEYLLSKTLAPKIKKAFILAGGAGVKMRPFTYEMPKTMLPVKGKPILEHIIDKLREHNIREIIILVGALGDKIKNHFGDGAKFGISIVYIEEPKEEGTAAPLRLAKNLLGNEPFLLLYGDVLADINLTDFIDFHSAHGGLTSIALTSVAKPSEYGVVCLHGDKVVDFTEKPHKAHTLSHVVFSGIQILSPKVIEMVPKKGFSMLENDLLPKLAKSGQLYGYLFEGRWYDVGTPEIYAEAVKEWGK